MRLQNSLKSLLNSPSPAGEGVIFVVSKFVHHHPNQHPVELFELELNFVDLVVVGDKIKYGLQSFWKNHSM